MDCKVQTLSDNISTVVDKMEFICSLATGLDLSHEIHSSLLSAKSSLTDCKLLIHVKLLQVTNKKQPFTNNTNYKDNTREDTFKEDSKILDDFANTDNFKKENDNIKLEDDNIININHDDLDCDNVLDDFVDIDAAVETKIEVEDDNENTYFESPPVAKIKRKRRSKDDLKVKRKRTKDPINETSHDSDEDFNLDKHLNISEDGDIDGESDFLCPICGKTKQSKDKFKNHVRAHKLKVKCSQCSAMIQRYQMTKHEEDEHGGPKVRVPKIFCRHCYKSFPQQEFKVHETECGPIDVVCTVCGKICPGRKNHTDHMRIHNQPAVHPCNFCGKKYRTVGDLRRHEQHTHIDLKTCDICGQDGMSIYNLKIHMKIHDENRERSFSCDECGMSFHRERGLKNHMMSHSEDKPYACDVCHKQFKYKNSLVTHLKLHNEDLPRVKCEHCGRAFAFQKYLRKHQRQVHKITFTSVKAKREKSSIMNNKIAIM